MGCFKYFLIFPMFKKNTLLGLLILIFCDRVKPEITKKSWPCRHITPQNWWMCPFM